MSLYLVDDHKMSLAIMDRCDRILARGGSDAIPGVKEFIQLLVCDYFEWSGMDGTIEALESIADLLHPNKLNKDAELLIRQAIAILRTNAP